MDGSSAPPDAWWEDFADCDPDPDYPPPPDYAWSPFTDTASQTILENAVRDLVRCRGGSDGDAGDALACLISLLYEGDSWLYELVPDARDQGYRWDAIAERLTCSVSAAQRRYAFYTKWRRAHPLLDLTASAEALSEGTRSSRSLTQE
jgi:hypothetical protein